MLDNRVLALGWNMGRKEEVPSWKPYYEPYEGDRPAPVPDEVANEQVELPFEI